MVHRRNLKMLLQCVPQSRPDSRSVGKYSPDSSFSQSLKLQASVLVVQHGIAPEKPISGVLIDVVDPCDIIRGKALTFVSRPHRKDHQSIIKHSMTEKAPDSHESDDLEMRGAPIV